VTAQAFVFESARCTGCEACSVACAIENRLPLALAWRQVLHANPSHLSWAPAFHLSMACNHCDRPACLDGCPASAYARDPGTGAVLLDQGRCIGCRYCSWMCPYDAPRFDEMKGVMAKCTFCHPRLLEGRAPACAAACPTGALAVEARGPLPEPEFPGVPQRGLGPGLRMAGSPLAAPRSTNPASAQGLAWAGAQAISTPRISWRSEWSLLAFTTLVPWLVAAQLAGSVTGVDPIGGVAFLGFGGVAGVLSLLHLGRPGRAWRAVSNLGRSWLSREILAFSLFVPLASAQIWAGLRGPGAAAVSLLGLALLLSLDRVYQSAEGRPPWRFHSAEALPAGLFLAGFLGGIPALLLPLALVRLGLYLSRQGRPLAPRALLAAAVRTAGLCLPCLAPWGRLESPSWLLVVAVLAGEWVDRVSFYHGLDLPTPGGQLEATLRGAPPGCADPA
jgi:Fe-S-cluster-containing dehydrogenase component/DMSO reductase anchor subunit